MGLSSKELQAMLGAATKRAEAMRTPDGWSIVAPYICINGLSALFTLARVSDPDEAEIGYTDGALDADTARANATLYAAAPSIAAELLQLRKALWKIANASDDVTGASRLIAIAKEALEASK